MKKLLPHQGNTVTVYILNGTEHEDGDTPTSPFQGKTLSTYFRDDKGDWISVMRNGDGTPRLGYRAEEINDKQASAWKYRITQAYANPSSGYIDTAGHWFPGEATNSVITLAAWNKLQLLRKQSFFLTAAGRVIDQMADKIMSSNHSRDAEYKARYQEAKEFKSESAEGKEYKYLAHLQYKGLNLKESAELVIAKYEKAAELDSVISGLRMKKSLLTGNLPLQEKEELYNSILAGLSSSKV